MRIRTRFGADLTRRTDLASAKIPASCTQKGTVVFGLLKCCRLVGNMQTLVPSGSQLAPTGSIPHGRKNIYYRKTRAHTALKKARHPSLSSNWVRSLLWLEKKHGSSSETNMFLTDTFIQQGSPQLPPTTVWTCSTMHMSIRNACAL